MNYTIKSMHYKEKCEKINKFTILLLTDETRLNYIKSAFSKLRAGRDKLNLHMANNSAPTCAFCFPYVAVCHPVTCYRPTVTSLAVVPKDLHMDTAEMIYKFLCVNRTHPHFNLCIQSIHANNEENARLSLNADFRYLATVAKINPKLDRTLAMKGGIYA